MVEEKKRGERPWFKGSLTESEQFGKQIALWPTDEMKKAFKISEEK
jgi:hypothetical protein